MQAGRVSCPACGTANDVAARFCSNCGNRLAPAEAPRAEQPRVDAPRRELERKVVTALFCDVVGSTELAERLDAEDVEQIMSTYHERARRIIETHGGQVEKFIGDAVVGLFGAPAAHEDDPARAVRAALAILRDLWGSGLGIHVRIGVHTGEAIVRVDADRGPEEAFATGGSLNTAARVQNAAPVDGIAVGDSTYHLAAADFRWEDLGAMSLKGIAEPVHIWRPVEARSSAAKAEDTEATPFLGRDAELATLVRAYDGAIERATLAAITIVSEPGLGKSRLVRELRRHVEATGTGAIWRVGRCLPYGDGIAFWALGEIVKSHAGILETDDQPTIGAKLDAGLTEKDPELRAWMRERLAPLVGLRTEAEPPAAEEAFAAWRRFLESLATAVPAVIVVEDLHWADTAFVAFLLDLVARPPARPILLVVTTRPEIAERAPAWLEQIQPARILQLVSLGDEAIKELIGSALGDAPPEIVQTVLERAAGSPLYAEQLALLVMEQGIATSGQAIELGTIPATVQALLAARIDALPREVKPALLDASVIGRVFWSGAIASLEGRDPASVEPALSDLERRSLTRSNTPSSMVDESEYAFWHALLRDVAYAILPRANRMAKHRAAAAWITAKAGDAVGDLAEIVVDHLRRASELAEATAAGGELPAIRSELADALLAAASHARLVEPGRAVGYLRSTLELLTEDDARRGATLGALGRAELDSSDYPKAAATLQEAQAWLGEHGEALAAAEIAAPLASALRMGGDIAAGNAVREAARPVLEANPGPGLVALLAADATAASELDRAVGRADAALALAERLGLPEPALARIARGLALLEGGDRSGEGEVRRGIAAGRASGDLRQALAGYAQLGWILTEHGTMDNALAVYDEGLAFAQDHGLDDLDLRSNRLDALDYAGRQDEVVAEAHDLRARAMLRGNAYAMMWCDLALASVRLVRGDTADDPEGLVEAARGVGFPRTGFVIFLAQATLDRGDPEAARKMIGDALDALPDEATVYAAIENVGIALELGDLDLARRIMSRAVPPGPTGRGYLSMLAMAMLAEAEGDLASARAAYDDAGTYFAVRGWPWYTANALAGSGRCLVGEGSTQAGLEALREARRLVEPLRAAPFIARLDAFISTV